MAVLDEILAETHQRVAALQWKADELAERARTTPPPPQWVRTGRQTVGVIAEVKRRSPSQGDIRPRLDAVQYAQAYERAGAEGISVLTEETHFGGSLEDLARVSAAVVVPVLRKDFILNEVQVVEARAAGASAVLLIARIVTPEQLEILADIVRGWNMTPLIEVHALEELDTALAVRPELLGVNARDLNTLVVDSDRAEAIIRRVPPGIPVVAESGVESRRDVERLAAAGADFVLVGTSVARKDDPERAVRDLVGVDRQPGVRR